MTRSDFYDRFQSINRTTKQFVWGAVFGFFLLTVLAVVPMLFVKADGIVIKATISVFAVAMVIFIGVGCGRLQRRLCCPKCERSLYGREGRKVYETGKCPNCGEMVFTGQ